MSPATLQSTVPGTTARLLAKYPEKINVRTITFWQDSYLLLQTDHAQPLWDIRERDALNRLESAARRHGDRDLLACFQRAVDQINTEVECGTLPKTVAQACTAWVAAVAFDIAMHGAKKGSPFA